MENLTGLLSVSAIFIVFASLFYYLYKKNIFGGNKKSTQYILKNDISNLNLAQLRKKNNALNKEIVFLEDKIEKLKIRIKELKIIIVDLEEQKDQLEANEIQLIKLRKQKDETLSMVAHDIKNPASTIKNFVDLLESYDLNAQEQHDILEGLMETSSRILELADEFSFVVSQENISFIINKERHNINTTVDSIVKSNKSNAEKKKIILNVNKSVKVPTTAYDDIKIKEVLDNLVGNAIKFSPPDTEVKVSTKYDNNYITVEIKDNGFGLTEDEVSKAFDKGSKLSTKPTGNEKSSGLGLWIAKKIVEEHDGKVWVKSKKGIGSTFAFKIPADS